MFKYDQKKSRKGSLNTRTITLIYIAAALLYLLVILFWGAAIKPESYGVRYGDKFLPPGPGHIFGTDFMGRDMFYRCIKGLSNSLIIGLAASLVSSVIGLCLGISAAIVGGKYDKFVLLCVDCAMGLPHLVLLILVSCMLGRGQRGVMLAVALTHWPELTRLVRGEVLQIRSAQYIQAAYRMGRTRLQVAAGHVLPHVIPVYSVGLVLLFPHAVMHESAITFLGFGLPAQTPAIGVILAESMGHIATGKWWLALFPGLMLILTVMLFYVISENLKKLWNPISGND